MAIEITGKLIQILQPVVGEGRNGQWKKQEFVIETNDQYPKRVAFSLWGEKTLLLNNIKEGTDIKVSFNPESREYNGRWFTELRAWRIENAGTAATVSASPASNFDTFSAPPPPVEFKDDLPF